MPRHATGQVVVRDGKTGRTYALRFRAYGKRRYQTLGTAEDGWDQRRAEAELQNVLADVRRGIWREPAPAIVVDEPRPEPTFHVFASEWFERYRGEWAERTRDDYQWALSLHLLPFFKSHRLSEITIEEVDRYRAAKIRERDLGVVDRPLSNVSINKTLIRLAQILEDAVEYGHIGRNPAKGRRRRLKQDGRARAWLEPDEVDVLIDSAGRNRALLSILIRAGLGVGEACDLRWADVDLTHKLIHVHHSKTDTGRRQVNISPALLADLMRHRAENPGVPAAYVFTTRTGSQQTRHNVRRRVLAPAVKTANEYLARNDRPPINPRLTTHSLRHTFASLLFEAGETVPYVMAQLGHKDPKVTLGIYAHVLNRASRAGAGRRTDALTVISKEVEVPSHPQSREPRRSLARLRPTVG